MQPRLLGIIERPGVIETACLLTPVHAAVVMRRRNVAEVIGVHFRATDRLTVAWWHPLEGGGLHNWAGHDVAINIPSVVPSESGRLIAVGGTRRLLLEGATGTIVAASAGEASPTAPVGVAGSQLLVPEGRSIVAHSADRLTRLERRALPDGYWAWAPPRGGFVPLEHEWDASGVLLNWSTGTLWGVPNGRYFRGAAIGTTATVLISSGLFASESLTALSLNDGSVSWQSEFGSPAGLVNQERRSLHSPISLLSKGEVVIAATITPAIDGMRSDNGHRLWSLPLDTTATTVAAHETSVWVGCADGTLLVADPPTGTLREQFKLNERDGFPVSILPVDDHNALVLTRLRLLYRWSI